MVAFLERELASWPQVSTKPMFGMLAFYRGKRIFAALPRTRALGADNALIYKLPTGAAGAGWNTVELTQDTAGMKDALRCLERAYRQARKKK